MNRETFSNLTGEEQWAWVLNNKEQIILIVLRKDSTEIFSHLFLDGDGDDGIEMNSYLGNKKGVFDLITAIGIPCRDH